MNMIESVLISTLRLSVPVIFASIGATFSVRSGVTAFGCEGMMLTASLFGVLVSYFTGSAWAGVFGGMLAGMLISSIHAVLHIKYKVNATLSGMSVNLLGTALGTLVTKLVWKNSGMSPDVEGFSKIAADPGAKWLTQIPVIGHLLGEQSVFFFIMIAVVILAWIVLFKTPFGLRMRMVGENPVAANTVGINTVMYKYIGVLMCGALSGLAGVFLSLASMNRFVAGMSAGRGYVAMVISNLGRSNPLGVVLAGLFFGFFDCLQTVFQSIETPAQLLMMMPYLFTLIMCIFSMRKSSGPAGVGKHFDD